MGMFNAPIKKSPVKSGDNIDAVDMEMSDEEQDGGGGGGYERDEEDDGRL